MKRTLFAVAAALLLSTVRFSAHHAFPTEYDESKIVTIIGAPAKQPRIVALKKPDVPEMGESCARGPVCHMPEASKSGRRD